MNKNITLSLFVILLMVIWVNAETVTFEPVVSPSSTTTPAFDPGETLETQGLTFHALPSSNNFSIAPAKWADSRSYLKFANNGTNYLRSYTNSGALSLGISAQTIFSLTSVDLAEYGSTSMPSALDSVIVKGYMQNGTILETTLQLDNIVDGSGGLEDFQTFYFDNSWTDLVSIHLGPAEGPARNIFCLDNVVYTNVPEPATMCLLGLGGLLLRRRRRKA